MKIRFNKILTVITAVTFVAALTINIQASLSDPFAGMSDEALALTSTGVTSETTWDSSEIDDCIQCLNVNCLLMHPTDPSKDITKVDHKWPDPSPE